LGVDLRKHGWHQQPRFDPGCRTFHWEHVYPVSALFEACNRQRSSGGILRVLQRIPHVAWILTSEDRRLTKLGFRSRRDDPVQAYRAAGIVLLP
jgi:hypothetical protein